MRNNYSAVPSKLAVCAYQSARLHLSKKSAKHLSVLTLALQFIFFVSSRYIVHREYKDVELQETKGLAHPREGLRLHLL